MLFHQLPGKQLTALKGTWETLKLLLKAKFPSVSVVLASYLDLTVLPEASFSYIVYSCSRFTPLGCRVKHSFNAQPWTLPGFQAAPLNRKLRLVHSLTNDDGPNWIKM